MLPTFLTVWISAHVALLANLWLTGSLLALIFGAIWPRLDPTFRVRWPRIEHAINAMAAFFIALGPFARSFYGMLVGTPVPTLPAFAVLDTRGAPLPTKSGVSAGRLLPLVVLVVLGCSSTPVPSDGGPVVTPSSWVSTITTVDTTLSWALPAADALLDGLVGPVAAVPVHLAFRLAEGTVTALQSSLTAYLSASNGGTMCRARAAITATATALEGVAAALVPTGYGVAPEIQGGVQALAAVADELVPACVLPDGGLPASTVAASQAVNAAPVLRPFPRLTPPPGVAR